MNGSIDRACERRIVGLDVGGANLKVAVAEGLKLTTIREFKCALWRGVDQLEAALRKAVAEVGAGDEASGPDEVRVTMTGELADVFPDRYTGVARIVETAVAAFGPRTLFWNGARAIAGRDPFVSPSKAVADWAEVASANFLATAALVARSDRLRTASPPHGWPIGLLIDIGSTTTDIVAFSDGLPTPRALDDAGRLVSGELVYTGLTRTPVPTVTTRGVFQGQWQTLAREPFATMADVHRLIGALPEGVDHYATADGREASAEASAARLARCFGRDCEPGDVPAWRLSAWHIAEVQLTSIVEACLQVASARPGHDTLVVAAGSGAARAAEVARRIGARHIRFAEAVGIDDPRLSTEADHAAPAAALALFPKV